MNFKKIIVIFLIASCVTACGLDHPKDETTTNGENKFEKNLVYENVIKEVNFDWDKDGKLDDIKLLRGEKDGPGYDDYLKIDLTRFKSSKILKNLFLWNGSNENYSELLKINNQGEVFIFSGVSNGALLSYESEIKIFYQNNNFVLDKYNRKVTTVESDGKIIERSCMYNKLSRKITESLKENRHLKTVRRTKQISPIYIDDWDEARCDSV